MKLAPITKALLTPVVISFLSVSQSDATLVSIDNYSFEQPDLGAGGATLAVPTGWNSTGVAEVGGVGNGWNGGAVNISNLDGVQAGWFNVTVGNGLYQVLPDTYTTGQSYELTVGIVKASSAWTNWTSGNEVTIELYYGDFNVIASASVLSDSLNDSQGALTYFTASLSTVEAGDAWANQSIGIRLVSTVDNSGGANDWAVDNVTLNAVPEPGSMALAGLSALLLIRRRRA
ncbi:PEP-CTERM sorting domain-containing protein [Luteolibacter pohnpeiensis]|uniref:PEP-CTERM sorting domain-containing protein n=1 Tax=Luteolibacter pohnpeiensis TaxID=454153 RepID=A0A934VPI7_9BACT|nr:PEP-CTERM sorting domain-containing protein [Luteolibacter pohnpeiensis]MBK1881046.1 PEP-CTERM sorting domain-containing protein [Luteolibacter pohnpeiensis]